MKIITPLFFVSLLFFSSCQDDELLPAEAQAKLLAGNPGSSKTWKLLNGTLQANGQDVVEREIDPCQLDDLFKFTNNGDQTYELRGGSIKCNVEDDDLLETGNWAFTLDGTMVIILSSKTSFTGLFNYWNMPFPAEIVSLTENEFKIRMVVLDDGDTIINIFTFKSV